MTSDWRAGALGLAVLLGFSGQAVSAVPVIEPLSNRGYQYLDGAGCYYTVPGHKVDFDNEATWNYRFLLTIDDSRKAWVRVDGKVHELKAVGRESDADLRRGLQRVLRYQGGGLQAVLDVKVGRAEEGQWTESGTLSVVRGGQNAVVQVEGDCGS